MTGEMPPCLRRLPTLVVTGDPAGQHFIESKAILICTADDFDRAVFDLTTEQDRDNEEHYLIKMELQRHAQRHMAGELLSRFCDERCKNGQRLRQQLQLFDILNTDQKEPPFHVE